MTFDFVIETPDRRGINRNNNKLIQKRATQAGAKTRLGNKLTVKSPDRDTSAIPRRLRSRSRSYSPSFDFFYANDRLSAKHNSPFLARYGDHGQVLYAQDNGTDSTNTCFRLQRTTMSLLQRRLLDTAYVQPKTYDVNRMFKVMTLTQRDFLLHLPSYYGYLGFLDDAIDCVIARIYDTVPIFGHDYNAVLGEASPTSLYGKALMSLRSVINNDLEENLPYVWFAIMLLTLFELLSTGDVFGWLWHVEGSARILHKVGADKINTDFLMSLLSSQCRIMVIEAIFSNKSCYLAEREWQEALRRTTIDCDDFSDRSEANTELSVMSARIPNMFQTVSDVVHHQGHVDVRSVRRIVERLHEDLRIWDTVWRDTLELTSRDDGSESTLRHQALTILLTYYMLSAIVCRLHISVSPYDNLDLEDEAISSCIGVLSLRRFMMKCQTPSHFRGSIYGRTTAGTHSTTAVWKTTIKEASVGGTISPYVFDQWCSMIGRQPYTTTGDVLSNHAEELAKNRLSNTEQSPT